MPQGCYVMLCYVLPEPGSEAWGEVSVQDGHECRQGVCCIMYFGCDLHQYVDPGWTSILQSLLCWEMHLHICLFVDLDCVGLSKNIACSGWTSML